MQPSKIKQDRREYKVYRDISEQGSSRVPLLGNTFVFCEVPQVGFQEVLIKTHIKPSSSCGYNTPY
jgi:hypothetical protein